MHSVQYDVQNVKKKKKALFSKCMAVTSSEKKKKNHKKGFSPVIKKINTVLGSHDLLVVKRIHQAQYRLLPFGFLALYS